MFVALGYATIGSECTDPGSCQQPYGHCEYSSSLPHFSVKSGTHFRGIIWSLPFSKGY